MDALVFLGTAVFIQFFRLQELQRVLNMRQYFVKLGVYSFSGERRFLFCAVPGLIALGNEDYFHIIGDGHQPNSRGLYTHYKDSYLKVG